MKKIPDIRPPGYELFFAPLAVALNPTMFERVQFAYTCSKYGHAKQLRDDGSRYFDHPKAAAWIYINELGGHDERVIINALLHDIQEDSYLLSTYRIKLNFGIDIALDVRALTKLAKGDEDFAEYLERIIARGPWAIISKLCDRLHNLRTLHLCNPEKQRKKIAETEDYLLPALMPALISCGGDWAGYAEQLSQKIGEEIALRKKGLN